MYYNFISLCMQCSTIVGQVVTTGCPACYSFNPKVAAWLLQQDVLLVTVSIPRLLHGCYNRMSCLLQFQSQGCCMVVTTGCPACYSFNPKVAAWLLQQDVLLVTVSISRLLHGCYNRMSCLLQFRLLHGCYNLLSQPCCLSCHKVVTTK